ncbi:hypothetical protein GW17_00020896 [Ensete ventricosum]|nr:hypothetical protein GW17_00020896 [Ensete ventricosum]
MTAESPSGRPRRRPVHVRWLPLGFLFASARPLGFILLSYSLSLSIPLLSLLGMRNRIVTSKLIHYNYVGIGPRFERCMGDRRKFAEGDREPAWSMPGVHRKLIERLVGSLPEDAGRFAKSSEDQLTS